MHLKLTPSRALHDEVAKRVLKAWQEARQGSDNLELMRKTVSDAKTRGVTFLGEDGAVLLGPEIAAAPALRMELGAADRAYGLAQKALSADLSSQTEGIAAVLALAAREVSNPYASSALDFASRKSAVLSEHVKRARADRGDTPSSLRDLVPPEPEPQRLGDAQVRSAVSETGRVIEERKVLTAALERVFVSPAQALEKIENQVHASGASADSIGREIRDKPDIYGEVRSFKSGWLGREDREAKGLALASASRAGRDFAATVHYYIGALRNNELEIAEQQAAGIPAPLRDLASALEQTPTGGTLFSGITQEDRRDRLVSEAQTLASQIQRRGPSQAGAGLTRQLASRLQDLQSQLKSAVTVERSRKLELEQRLEGQQVSR